VEADQERAERHERERKAEHERSEQKRKKERERHDRGRTGSWLRLNGSLLQPGTLLVRQHLRGGSLMKSKPIVDGGRRRCVDCGHPRREHGDNHRSTVPKCECLEYQLPKAG